MTMMTAVFAFLACLSASGAPWSGAIEPLPGEKWWGGDVHYGSSMPYADTRKPIDLSTPREAAMPLLVSNRGRYVWSDRPFAYAFSNGVLRIVSARERLEPVQAGATLKEAYLAACAKHFPFDGRIPAELLFTKPQWNNWIEIAIQGKNQATVDAYTEALAKSGFPCGVYLMDGGWLTHQGSYRFNADFPDPKGLFRRIHDNGWKAMIWTAHFISPDSLEAKRLRFGRGYMIDGLDYLAYSKFSGQCRNWPAAGRKAPGVFWWWSGVSSTWDLTYAPARAHYLKTLTDFAAEYGVDGFKFDGGDASSLSDGLRFHDPNMEAVDFVHEYVRLGADHFPYNEFRVGFRNGGMPVMTRLLDLVHSWEALARASQQVQGAGLAGAPYCVADMVGGGDAMTYRPGSFFSEKLFIRFAALQALQPMMQFSAAPWRYLSPKGVAECRAFAELHCAFGPYVLDLARHAAKTGEPIARTMEYEFPGQGFDRSMSQFMLGTKWLVAPVVREDDSVDVSLPAGTWRDDLGGMHAGPKELTLRDVPTARLPRYERMPE